MSNIFLEYTIYRRSCKENNVRTQIIASCAAEFAVTAGFTWFKGNFVADLKMFYIFTNFYNNTAWFVSKNKWRFYYIITDCSLLIVVEIGSTDTNILKFNQYFVVLWSWDWTLCEAHFANTVHYSYFHFFCH